MNKYVLKCDGVYYLGVMFGCVKVTENIELASSFNSYTEAYKIIFNFELEQDGWEVVENGLLK